MRVLVVGAGIAGLSCALSGLRRGLDVELIERHPSLRSAGYMIDFFGPGFDAAERLGLLPALETIHYPVGNLVFVDEQGRPRASLAYPRLRRALFRDRHFNFMRGELERLLYEQLDGVKIRFGVRLTSLALEPTGVRVETSDGARDRFDVVVGADGVRSAVRGLVMEKKSARLVSLGCRTAAYVARRPVAGLAPDAFVTLSLPGKTVAAYPIGGGRVATFFVHRVRASAPNYSASACRDELEASYRNAGWVAASLLDGFPDDGDVYFDEVVQTEVDRWSEGRVVLLGDACGCVSLVAGQGASMALAGAYILTTELARATTPIEAFARYEARVRPAVEQRQRSGRRNAGWFLPRSKLTIGLRDRLMTFAVGSSLAPLLSRSLGGGTIPLD